ncbi:hypothetical protein FACS1894174_08910 [Bacteroidia bacterium]|nr:hypothetical protein FACS1894174_08910 [Bacteroidia bacterium]
MIQLKKFIYILLAIVLLLFTACEQKDLFLCSPAGDIPVNVKIHWDNVPANQLVLPGNMTVHWYPKRGQFLSFDMSPFGGREWLNADIYNTMCLDFNGNTKLAFRSNGTCESFEVYNIRMTGLYNSNVPQLPGGEVTVAEAYPYQFYIDPQPQTVDMENVPYGDTVTVHFYPKNILKEFTFLIYDVKGAKYMVKNSGAISGMSGSYFPANNKLATSPSTILFQRVEAIKDGQVSSRWTDEQKRLFSLKNPNWANSDTLIGWTRDWVTGQFVTFGPLSRKDYRFRLTVDAISNANNHYHGSWGYWHGEWEDKVAAQIDSAMGKNGTWEEQLAWRQRNGGYDIVLYNDNRLIISDGEGKEGGIPDGGFIVNVDDWGDIINVPVAGSSSSPAQKSPVLKSSVNTYATIFRFVVNGVWTGGNEPWNHIFNEQHVYKPESGSSVIWDYSPKKYWPSSGEVTFYAYAPGGLSSTNLIRGLRDNGDDQNVPVLEYVFSQTEREEPPPGTGEPPTPKVVSNNQEDLLVAVQNRTSPQNVPVPMNFRHAFSRVNVKARNSSSGYRIKLTRVDLRGLKTQGKIPLAPDNDNPALPSSGIPMEANRTFKYNGSVKLWTDLENLCDYRLRLIAPTVTVENLYTNLLRNDDKVFVIPQTVTSSGAIYVEYDVYKLDGWGDEIYETSVSKQFSLPAGFSFEIGRQYELQITLNYP